MSCCCCVGVEGAQSSAESDVVAALIVCYQPALFYYQQYLPRSLSSPYLEQIWDLEGHGILEGWLNLHYRQPSLLLADYFLCEGLGFLGVRVSWWFDSPILLLTEI
jgi:hypothetical protein